MGGGRPPQLAGQPEVQGSTIAGLWGFVKGFEGSASNGADGVQPIRRDTCELTLADSLAVPHGKAR